jgi:hypothetical protein
MARSAIARDEELYVTCKTCGFPVATGLRARADRLPSTQIHPREHRCPRCGQAHTYSREDYAHRV